MAIPQYLLSYEDLHIITVFW